jgi:hypothetical protein
MSSHAYEPEDEITTTYGTLKAAQAEAFIDGVMAERTRVLDSLTNLADAYDRDEAIALGDTLREASSRLVETRDQVPEFTLTFHETVTGWAGNLYSYNLLMGSYHEPAIWHVLDEAGQDMNAIAREAEK